MIKAAEAPDTIDTPRITGSWRDRAAPLIDSADEFEVCTVELARLLREEVAFVPSVCVTDEEVGKGQKSLDVLWL